MTKCKCNDVLSHPGSPPITDDLEIRIRRGGISIQGPAIWAVPGSPHFYTMHGCGSRPSATDGNSHTQIPRRLAHSGPVAGSFNITQNPHPQPLRLPGSQSQLCREHTVTQPTSFVPGYSYRLKCQQLSQQSEPRQFSAMLLQGRYCPSAQSFPENEEPASPVLQLGLLHMRPVLAETEGSIRGLASRTPPMLSPQSLC